MIEDIKQGDNLNRDDLIELIDNHLPPPLVSYIRVEGYYGDLISILQDVYQSGRKILTLFHLLKQSINLSNPQ
ncbi:MAG: hypothetical protein IPI97_15355 [Nitrosomonas sp.]|nr:hypothetical protein [Nitrosomonas sp.]